ncbi:hypothetical protein HJC23_008741 [Cyclotella cryptica]|uniref:DUF6824 domain-containing protein n=1 Tax=Cyclotella cryptica TaxID=29204 RepID=A0ABD3PC50_9STRA|eukprot:CCRYP_015836-RA/>CCRYP_015836-RA protein AED:0.17 eAED:0.17 QI:0/-1/0/1/-1/1/1/0/388
MNPLLFFSRFCGQSSLSPLNNCAVCKALASSSALTAENNTNSNSDNGISKTTSQWAFEYLQASTINMADWLYYTTSSWFVLPIIARMQDSNILNIKNNMNIIKPMAIKPSVMRIGTSSPHKGSSTRCDAMERRTHADVTEFNINKTTRRISSGSISPQPDLVDEPMVQPSVPLTLPWLYGKNVAPSRGAIEQDSPPPTLRRVDSKEWIKDYKNKKERIDKINFNNIFGGRNSDADNNEIPSLPPLNSTYEHLSERSVSPKYTPQMNYPIPSSPSSISSRASILSTLTTTEPAPEDVICGRGGKANSHPGNVTFRAEALKLRSWYESSSKSEKFTISNLLVDFVKERGGRFLKRDGENPGRWLECDGNDVRKKASQALREGKLKDLSKD